MARIQPLRDKILIEELKAEDKTATGIILPDSAKEKPQQGKVLEVGTGKIIGGKKVELEVKKGDIVIFSQYSGDEIKLEGKEYKLIKEEDILAVIK